jgi:hypothetical protein
MIQTLALSVPSTLLLLSFASEIFQNHNGQVDPEGGNLPITSPRWREIQQASVKKKEWTETMWQGCMNEENGVRCHEGFIIYL